MYIYIYTCMYVYVCVHVFYLCRVLWLNDIVLDDAVFFSAVITQVDTYSLLNKNICQCHYYIYYIIF